MACGSDASATRRSISAMKVGRSLAPAGMSAMSRESRMAGLHPLKPATTRVRRVATRNVPVYPKPGAESTLGRATGRCIRGGSSHRLATPAIGDAAHDSRTLQYSDVLIKRLASPVLPGAGGCSLREHGRAPDARCLRDSRSRKKSALPRYGAPSVEMHDCSVQDRVFRWTACQLLI